VRRRRARGAYASVAPCDAEALPPNTDSSTTTMRLCIALGLVERAEHPLDHLGPAPYVVARHHEVGALGSA
jgi:hypothetical protein